MLAPNTDIQTVLKAAGRPGWLKLVRNPWVLVAIAVALAAVVALVYSSTRSTPDVTYRTAPAAMGNLAVLITATGTIQPINEVTVGSELSGIVDSVEVDYNDSVTVGQVLARLDTTKLQAQLASSEAGAVSARAGVAQAKATVGETSAALNRTRTLQAKGIVTQRELETAEAAYNRAVASEEVAEAQLKVAEADVTSRRTDLSKAAIVSPINGIVLKRDIDPGQTVAASLQAPVLFTIAEDLTQMHLVVDVDEADAAQVADGQTATFTVAAHPDRTFPATVRQVRYFPNTVNNVVTYQAVLAVDNSDLALRPGMTATADIKVQGKDGVLIVPNAALRFSPTATSNFGGGRGGRNNPLSLLGPRSGGGANRERSAPEAIPTGSRRIWVLENGEARPRIVGVGATDGTNTEITSGNLKAGDRVIIDAVETR
jgi:HlyD family secretion protein